MFSTFIFIQLFSYNQVISITSVFGLDFQSHVIYYCHVTSCYEDEQRMGVLGIVIASYRKKTDVTRSTARLFRCATLGRNTFLLANELNTLNKIACIC